MNGGGGINFTLQGGVLSVWMWYPLCMECPLTTSAVQAAGVTSSACFESLAAHIGELGITGQGLEIAAQGCPLVGPFIGVHADPDSCISLSPERPHGQNPNDGTIIYSFSMGLNGTVSVKVPYAICT